MSGLWTKLSEESLGESTWSFIFSESYVLIIVSIETLCICIILCLLSPDAVLYVVLELISKNKHAVCKLDDEPVSFEEVLCVFVLGFVCFFSVKVGDIDFSALSDSDLTNCIFKFWSNTTWRLVLYICIHVLNFLKLWMDLLQCLDQNLAPYDLQIQRLK